MKKTSINSTIVKYLFPLVLFLCTSLPVLASELDDDGDPEEFNGDPGQAPISDYWWVLVIIGIYYIYKKYQVLQKQA